MMQSQKQFILERLNILPLNLLTLIFSHWGEIPFFHIPWAVLENYDLFASCLKEVCINSVSVPFQGYHDASAILVEAAQEK
jgi:hypothetical protein